MRITALVENQTDGELRAKHGLSLFIETPKHKILFDLGPDGTLFENCKKLQIDLRAIDTVVISHGHMDHGGALEQFLQINGTAKVYVQRKAFEKHYTKILLFKFNVGIDKSLMEHPQIVLVDGDYSIDDELMLFTVPDTKKGYSPANDALYTDNGKDDYSHEQNLLVFGEPTVLVMGCGHAGIVNIMEKAQRYSPKVCVGGYHLYNPLTKRTVSPKLLDEISGSLKRYDVQFHTCHCTGQTAFNYLSQRLDNMHYLSCGKTIQL